MIETDRLILRQWTPADTPLFIQLNSDPAVMQYFPSIYTKEETEFFIQYCSQSITEKGWGFRAIEEKSTAQFIGMTGLNTVPGDLPISQSLDTEHRTGTQ